MLASGMHALFEMLQKLSRDNYKIALPYRYISCPNCQLLSVSGKGKREKKNVFWTRFSFGLQPSDFYESSHLLARAFNRNLFFFFLPSKAGINYSQVMFDFLPDPLFRSGWQLTPLLPQQRFSPILQKNNMKMLHYLQWQNELSSSYCRV